MIVEGQDGFEYGSLDDVSSILVEVQAAADVSNARGLIWQWQRRGLVRPVRRIGRMTFYRVADVMAAEMRTRVTKTRRGGAKRLTSA